MNERRINHAVNLFRMGKGWGSFLRGFRFFVKFHCNFHLSFISHVVYLKIFQPKRRKNHEKSGKDFRKKARKNQQKG